MFGIEMQGNPTAASNAVAALAPGTTIPMDANFLARVQTLANGVISDLQNLGIVSGPQYGNFHVKISGSGGNMHCQLSLLIESVQLDSFGRGIQFPSSQAPNP